MMPAGLTVMLAVEPMDMRKSFDGLARAVQEQLGHDASVQRMMFVFVNRRRDFLKLLWRDATGWCLLAKRLDERVVSLPRDIAAGSKVVRVDARTLAALLDGVVRERVATAKDVAREAEAACARVRDLSTTTTQQSSRLGRE